MRRRLAVVLLAAAASGCETMFPGRGASPPPPPPPADETPPAPKEAEPHLEVKKVQQEIVVAAWAEPRSLPAGGGAVQLLVRVQKRGGAPFPGVEVRFLASPGSLYSHGSILTTDRRGMTRDRLTTQKTTLVTLNAGGTRYRFHVPVEAPPEPN